MSMKSVTAIKHMVIITIMMMTSTNAQAQASAEINPLDVAAIKIGSDSLNAVYSKEIAEYEKILALQTAMNLQLNKIRKWGQEYNSYLETIAPFFKNVALVRNLYTQGAAIIQNAAMLTKCINMNPEGLAASVPLTNIYIEVATEFFITYKTFKDCIGKGGKDNMLNTTERLEMLWVLSDNMRVLNEKLRRMAMTIAFSNFKDAWDRLTEGIVPRDANYVANAAHRRWVRIYKAHAELNRP